MKKLALGLLGILLMSCVVVPLVSATNPYVWIEAKDSKGVWYSNCNIYAYANYVPGIGLSSAAQYIGNTGKTGWLGWNGYIGAPLGYSYKFEARTQAGKVLGSMNLLLFPKQQNIYIIVGKFVK